MKGKGNPTGRIVAYRGRNKADPYFPDREDPYRKENLTAEKLRD